MPDGPIKDPTTGLSFPGNVVPTSRILPYASLFISKYVPTANSAGNFYSFTPGTTLDENQITGRVDYDLGAKDKTWFRYFYDNVPQVGTVRQLTRLGSPASQPSFRITTWAKPTYSRLRS